MPSAASSDGPPDLIENSVPSGTLDGTAVATGAEPDPPIAAPAESTAAITETKRGRSRRHARRARLYGYTLVIVALVAVVVALGATNTAKTKVSWIVGSSHVPLVWMVLATVVLGWLLGLLTAAALHRRTRAPR